MTVAVSNPRPRTKHRRTSTGWVDRHSRIVFGFIGVAGLLIFWELGSRAGLISNFFFSRPTAILAAGAREVQVPRFWTDVQVSVVEFLTGYLLAIALGIPLGLLIGWYRRVQYVFDPWLNFLNSLPRFSLMPVIVIAFGLGILSKITVVFLGAFFAIVIPTAQGVRTVDRRLLDVATSFGASKRRLFLTVVAPSTVPFIITGLRLGIARALIGVVTGELFAATNGLGVMINRASQALQTDRLLFGVLLFTVAGVIGVEAIRRIESYFQRWRPVRGRAMT